MSPKEQLDIMCSQEEKMKAKQREPNEKDLEASIDEFSDEPSSRLLFSDTMLMLISLTQRHMYYIAMGVPTSMLAPQPPQQMMNVMRLLPAETEDTSKHPQLLRANMVEEVEGDYYVSIKKSIGMHH